MQTNLQALLLAFSFARLLTTHTPSLSHLHNNEGDMVAFGASRGHLVPGQLCPRQDNHGYHILPLHCLCEVSPVVTAEQYQEQVLGNPIWR